MYVKVKIHEFTYKDKNGYKTIVGEGNVPDTNPEVQAALKSRVLIPFPEPRQSKSEPAVAEVSAGRKDKREK
jgi:hypothetical protein